MTRRESRKRRSPFLSLSFRLVATVCCILLLLSYVSVLIDPGIFPLAGFFGLYFIPMLAVNVLLLVLALLRWSSSAWIPVIALLPSLFFVGFFFRAGDRNALPESVVARTDGLKVLTWNVGGFRSGVSDEVEDNIRGVTALVAPPTWSRSRSSAPATPPGCGGCFRGIPTCGSIFSGCATGTMWAM